MALEIILGVLMLVFCCFSAYHIGLILYRKLALHYNVITRTTIVTEKEYMGNADAFHKKAEKFFMLEKHNVHLQTEDNYYYCLNDMFLYNNVKVGDTVILMIYKGYNKHNQLKHTYIRAA